MYTKIYQKIEREIEREPFLNSSKLPEKTPCENEHIDSSTQKKKKKKKGFLKISKLS